MLYNTHLSTFIEVVEAGSFRRAAEQIGISPSAVLKQITLLENDLQINLFDRSRRGVTLTEAGESMYRDARYVRQYCDAAAERAKELYTKETNTVRIGVSAMTPVQPLVEMWPEILRRFPEIKCRFAEFDCTNEGWEKIISNLGQSSDLVLGIYDEKLLEKYGVCALKLGEFNAVIAVPLLTGELSAEKTVLGMDELKGHKVLLPAKGKHEAADAFREEAERYGGQIRLESFDSYCMEVFYRCRDEGACIFTYDIWNMGHMLLSPRPLEGEYRSSFGVLYSRDASEIVLRLVQAIKEIRESSENG